MSIHLNSKSTIDSAIESLVRITVLVYVSNDKCIFLFSHVHFRSSGDRLSAQAGASNQWPSPQNIKLTLAYPRSGVGNVVTYVQVIVEQVCILFIHFAMITVRLNLCGIYFIPPWFSSNEQTDI